MWRFLLGGLIGALLTRDYLENKEHRERVKRYVKKCKEYVKDNFDKTHPFVHDFIQPKKEEEDPTPYVHKTADLNKIRKQMTEEQLKKIVPILRNKRYRKKKYTNNDDLPIETIVYIHEE